MPHNEKMPNNENKIPAPLYAAAGAGDIAIERLRKLPEKVAAWQERVNTLSDQLPGRVSTLQDKVTAKVAEVPSMVAELRQRVVDADTDKLRESAKRNAQTLLVQAQAAQEKAASLYADLVARGEQVVGRTAPAARDTQPIRAEVIETEKSAVQTAKPEASAKASSAPKASSAAKANTAPKTGPATKKPTTRARKSGN